MRSWIPSHEVRRIGLRSGAVCRALPQPAIRVIERLLPSSVEAAEAFEDDPGEMVFPGEEDLIVKAVPSRQREFITARRCAREALARLGYPPLPIRQGERRAPRWPVGVIGSITHSSGYRAAAVANAIDLTGIGIDAEPHEPLPDGVLSLVSCGDEPDMLRRLVRHEPSIHWDRLLFSAKESIYKVWYPLTGRWLGFDGAQLSIDPVGCTFTARLSIVGERLDCGPPLTDLQGRYLVAGGLVLTAVSV